jgi:hypothetical protein
LLGNVARFRRLINVGIKPSQKNSRTGKVRARVQSFAQKFDGFGIFTIRYCVFGFGCNQKCAATCQFIFVKDICLLGIHQQGQGPVPAFCTQ